MRRFAKLLSLLLCAALLCGPAQVCCAQEPAPQVRIRLTHLALTDRADLWLSAPYSAQAGNGARLFLPDGAHITLQLRGQELCLFYQGASFALGQSVTFTRHAGVEELSGLQFAEGGSLYPADLRITVEGGQLVPVVRLSVEHYLQGVVPYEMSNSFPLEALKAQAVCARTYALAHVDSAKPYDMVDNTTSQVFHGIDPRNAAAARAVQETAGVVGTWKGALAVCYYAASNGGQTDLPSHMWPGDTSLDGCYAMKDDPYDLENPESPVVRFRLRRDGSNFPASWLALLSTEGTEARVDAVESAALSAPLHKGSRCMTALSLTLRWSSRTLPAATPAPLHGSLVFTDAAEATPGPWMAQEPKTLRLEVFGQVLEALDLSLSGTAHELLTLTESGEAFVLEARRYGHGVGMSQRGAQAMAGKHGKSFVEILQFYYPGMTLKQAASGAPLLSTPDPLLAATPGPAATPTPRPTLMPATAENLPEGAWMASVENIDDDSSLNLREKPSTAADILMRLYKHQRLIVLPDCEAEGWAHVRTDSVEGYVMLEFLRAVP